MASNMLSAATGTLAVAFRVHNALGPISKVVVVHAASIRCDKHNVEFFYAYTVYLRVGVTSGS